MNICDICCTAFEEPLTNTTNENIDGHIRTDIEYLCPACCNPYFRSADLCPRCGIHYKRKNEDILCRECRADLLRRFIDFADGLTAEEEEQIDEWMDGASIEERRKWA